jgi:hypothetical protein
VNTPMSFVEAWCAHQGAVVEPLAEGVEILQPTELATGLGLPEHARYSEQPGSGSVWVGYGSPVLEKFLQAATREVPWAALTLEPHTGPREAAGRKAAEHFSLRNAVHTVEEVRVETAARLVAYIRYSLFADDRRDGLVEEAVSSRLRVSVPGFWGAAQASGRLHPYTAPPSGDVLVKAVSAALVRGEAQARALARGFLEGFARRQERDLRRMEEYFQGLRAELDKRSRRAKVAPEDRALKAAAIDREREAKLQELRERSQVRLEAALAAAVWVEAPVAGVVLRARRRKAERALGLEYDFATHRLLVPACEACGLDAPLPALCDERLHVICAQCVPRAEGRWQCPACRRQ